MTRKYNVIAIEDYYLVRNNPPEGFNRDFPDWKGLPLFIATIGKRIGNLPLIEIPRESVDRAYVEYCKSHSEEKVIYDSFEAGYKAATKTYTEEDIKEAILDTCLRIVLNKFTIPSLEAEAYVAKLRNKKKPITAVELELVPDFPEVDEMTLYALKISENNIITPKQIFYE